MNSVDAIKHIAKITGTKLTSIGPAIGRKQNYVSVMAYKNTQPYVENLIEMLEVCGYGLYAMPVDSAPEDAIRID